MPVSELIFLSPPPPSSTSGFILEYSHYYAKTTWRIITSLSSNFSISWRWRAHSQTHKLTHCTPPHTLLAAIQSTLTAGRRLTIISTPDSRRRQQQQLLPPPCYGDGEKLNRIPGRTCGGGPLLPCFRRWLKSGSKTNALIDKQRIGTPEILVLVVVFDCFWGGRGF